VPVTQVDTAARKPALQAALLVLATLGLSGSGFAAEKHQSPLTTIMNTHLYADPGPVPDWVEKSRPVEGSDYIKLHASQPERHAKPKSPAELKAMEAELDAAAAANRRRAGLASAAPAKKSSKVSTVQSGSAPIH
jgi:hypothetical protein